MSSETTTATAPVAEVTAVDRDRMYQASEILLEARRTLTPIAELPPNLRPTSLAEAYFLQDIMIQELGAVAGWKVGAPSPDDKPIYAPMYDFGIASSGSIIVNKMRRLRGVEAEIAFLLKHDLPPREQRYTRDEVVAAIASAHPAIELIESAYFNPDEVDRLSMIGDLQMHGGFVHGPAFAGWRDFDYSRENVTVSVDGAVRTDKGANAAGPDILRLVEWLANEAQPRTGGLYAGQWITTGSWMGKTMAAAGSQVRVHFDHFGDVSLVFEDHQPRHPRTEPVVNHS